MSRNVNVPNDAVVLVLTPKQARQFGAWFQAVNTDGVLHPVLPNTLIQKIKAACHV